MSTTLKLSLNNQLRRVSINVSHGFTYSMLVERTKVMFPTLNSMVDLEFVWVDDEGDRIAISSDVELDEAIRVMRSENKGYLKFQIVSSDTGVCFKEVFISNAVHTEVSCDECGMKPLVGIRYKCTTRPNFDLCQNCESKKLQPYPMIKVYSQESPIPPQLVHVIEKGRGWGCGRGGRGGGWRGRSGCRNVAIPVPSSLETLIGQFLGQENFPLKDVVDKIVNEGNPNCPLTNYLQEILSTYPETTCKMEGSPSSCQEDVKTSESSTIEEQLVNAAMNASLGDAFLDQNVPPHFEESSSKEQSIASVSVSESKAAEADSEDYVDCGGIKQDNNVQIQSFSVPIESEVESFRPPQIDVCFVNHVTIQDQCEVVANTVFYKTWKVRNNGPDRWPSGCKFVSVGNDEMGEVSQFLPPVGSGAEEEISVALRSPANPGRHVAFFQFLDPNGYPFGQKLWVDINVPDVVRAYQAPAAEYKPVEPSAPSAVSRVPDPLALKWATEIEYLVSMGFTDQSMIISLLQENVKDPNCADKAQRMSRVVNMLLN